MFPLLHLTLLILSVNLIQPTAEPTAEVSVSLPLVEAGNNGEPANRFPLNLVLTIVFYLLSNTPLAFCLSTFLELYLVGTVVRFMLRSPVACRIWSPWNMM